MQNLFKWLGLEKGVEFSRRCFLSHLEMHADENKLMRQPRLATLSYHRCSDKSKRLILG